MSQMEWPLLGAGKSAERRETGDKCGQTNKYEIVVPVPTPCLPAHEECQCSQISGWSESVVRFGRRILKKDTSYGKYIDLFFISLGYLIEIINFSMKKKLIIFTI